RLDQQQLFGFVLDRAMPAIDRADGGELYAGCEPLLGKGPGDIWRLVRGCGREDHDGVGGHILTIACLEKIRYAGPSDLGTAGERRGKRDIVVADVTHSE